MKDDSGSCAVCTELGSSASEMTAAKGMGVTARLPGCAGQAADAVSALYPSQNGGRFSIVETSQSENVQIFGYVYHDTSGRNHGPVWKTQSFFSNEICMVNHLPDCGQHNLKKFFGSTKLGMPLCA